MDDMTGSTFDAALASNPGPLARRTLEYTKVMKGIMDKARVAPVTPADWDPLAALIDTAKFERVGTFMETVDWPAQLDLLVMWANGCEWYPRLRRVTEKDGTVFLELSELAIYDGREERINTVTVFDYGPDERVVRLGVYMQRAFEEEKNAQHKKTWDYEPS